MLAVASLRCIGIANVAAGAVARPTASVIPAARVLRNIAAECSLVADLRRRHQFRGLRQQTVLLLDDGMIHHLGERGHGADLDTIAGRANSAQFLDSAQIDHSLRLLDSIFQPVEAVETSGQHQGVGSVPCEKLLRVSDGTRLIQLERGHYVSNDSHDPPSNLHQICAISACCIGRPASSDVRIVSAFTGARWKISSPSASERAFKTEAHPPPTGGSPTPRAPAGVSGSGISNAVHCILTGTSRIVGGLL